MAAPGIVLHRESVGQWVKPGKPFCEVGDPRRLEAHLIIDQSDIHLIQHRFDRLDQDLRPGRDTFKSRVAEIAKRSREEVPTELSNMAGGEVASKPDPKTGTAKPLTAVYEVIIPIDNDDLELEPGLRGCRQDRRRALHRRLVADAVVEQDLQLPALGRDRVQELCSPTGPTGVSALRGDNAVCCQHPTKSNGRQECRPYG